MLDDLIPQTIGLATRGPLAPKRPINRTLTLLSPEVNPFLDSVFTPQDSKPVTPREAPQPAPAPKPAPATTGPARRPFNDPARTAERAARRAEAIKSRAARLSAYVARGISEREAESMIEHEDYREAILGRNRRA